MQTFGCQDVETKAGDATLAINCLEVAELWNDGVQVVKYDTI